MKTLSMLAGTSGCDKSTWAKVFAQSHPHTRIIDADETRKKITGSYLIFPETMEIIFDAMIQETNAIFAKEEGDCTVIEDSIFLDDYRCNYHPDRIVGYDKAILFLIKMHDYSICYARNKARPRREAGPDRIIAPKIAERFGEVRVEYWN